MSRGPFRLAVAALLFAFLLGLFPYAVVYDDAGAERVMRDQSLASRHDPGAESAGNWFWDDGLADMRLATAAAWMWAASLACFGLWAWGEVRNLPRWLHDGSLVAAPILLIACLFLFGSGLERYFAGDAQTLVLQGAPGWIAAAVIACTLLAWSWQTPPLRALRRLGTAASPASASPDAED